MGVVLLVGKMDTRRLAVGLRGHTMCRVSRVVGVVMVGVAESLFFCFFLHQLRLAVDISRLASTPKACDSGNGEEAVMRAF